MKKKLMGITSIVAVAAVAGYNMYSSRSEIRLSDLALANVEAFAQNESNPNKQKCYRKWRKASSQDALAIWDWVCQDCESYWLLEAGQRNECSK